MPLLIILAGIAILLALIIGLRVNAFIALILVALGVGLAQGMPMPAVMESIEKGVGSTLGYLALVLGFGAMLGALLADSGAARQITERLTTAFGIRRIQWAVILAGFIVGVPMFYTVGFVMLIPLIFTIGASSRLPLLYVGIPMVAALSVTHGFLPPHPAPTAIADFYQADVGLVLLYGLILAVPTIILAGPVFGSTLKKIKASPAPGLFELKPLPPNPPSFATSLFTALIPVILMMGGAIAKLLLPPEGFWPQLLQLIGGPVMALLIAVLVASYTLGVRTGRSLREAMEGMAASVGSVAMILLIIGAGGAFKQVLIDSGVGDYISASLQDSQASPLLLAWGIAAALRISLGSATVAALTAAGIVAPLIGVTDTAPELLVLATGAGSLTFSNVNDTGFWLFKEYFNLSIADTFRSWTVMETIVSVVGLAGCFVLDGLLGGG